MDLNPLDIINDLNNAIGHDTASVLEFLHITDPAVKPEGVREVARKWTALAHAVEDSSRDAHDALSGVVWEGKAADAFSQRTAKVQNQAADIANALHQGSGAINQFADAAESLIDEIGKIAAEMIEFEVAGLALSVITAGFSEAASTIAAGERAMKIVELIGKIEEEGGILGNAIKAVMEAIRGLDRVLEALKDIKGVATVAKMAKDGMAFSAFSTLLEDPKALTDPGKLTDILAEGAIAGIGFGVLGKALGKGLKAMSPAALSALSKGLSKLDDLTPARFKLRPEDMEKLQSAIENGAKLCRQDPVDVVTGDMLLTQRDVELPAALPVVLERTHLSSYRSGGWFGRTWASTLDQRLQLDEHGVVFATADGLRLCYPIPQPNIPEYPEHGPRWPLFWDGRHGGRMHITDPTARRTYVFAHPLSTKTDGVIDLPLRAIEDRNGNRITIAYSIGEVPVEIRHDGGYRIAIDRHPDQPRITALRLLDTDGPDTSTTLVRYGYDQAGHLTEVINSSGLPLQFTYDHVGRVTSWTDRNGTIYTYTYDTQGRCIRGEGSNGYQSGTFVYDDANRTTHITNALGHTTTVVYNEAYRPISETDPLGNTTLTEWDADNRLITAITDPLGRTTQNAYDDAGNPTTILRADGSVTDITYNALGLITSVTEPDGAIWRYEHDDRGNRTLVVDPSGSMTKYEYDGHGRPMTVTDALGHTHRIATNNAGLPTAVTDPLGRTTTLERDAFGRLTEMTDPLGHRICHGWTPEGRLSWREAADGSRETWAWDGEGNLTAHTDAAGNTNLYTYSYFDLLASHTTPDGTTYRFTYDAELHLTSVVNPQGRTWSYEYDPAGHLVAETDFNGRRLTYVHDAAGQLVRRTNGAGETVTYQRDLLGRTIERRGGSHSETFQYDSAGRLLRAANNAATVAFEHDQLGRVLTESVNGRQSSYEYDLLGRRTSRQLPSGAVSQWTYDAAGQPTALSVGGHTLTFDYDAAGRETHRRLDHGIRLVQEWNPVDRLISQTLETEGAGEAEARLQHRTYDYREDGFLTEIRELNSGTRRFDVNRGGQVTAVHARDWSETYAYDSAGNLSRASVPESSIGDEREFEGTLIRRTTKCRYDHDDQGRLIRATKRLLNGQVRIWSYTWDVNDRLTDVVTPDGTHWHYVYDPLGRRLSKQRLQPDGSHAESTSFIWDGTRVTEQIQATGQTTTWDYALDDHRPLYQIDHDPTQADYDARFYAIVTDLVGAPAELVGSDGRIAWQQRSTLWGSTAPSASSQSEVDCPLRFPGQYHDPETGWNYNYFRHYDPDTARYATPDPLGLEPADNDYAYVSNPLFWFDPLGLGACPRTASAAQLQDFYQQAEKYGKGGIRDLESGRIRFYGEVSLARNPGEMIGRRLVREWDPMTGNKRIWHETLDNEGNVRIVRPDVNVTGGKKVHYMFDKDGKFTGTF